MLRQYTKLSFDARCHYYVDIFGVDDSLCGYDLKIQFCHYTS